MTVAATGIDLNEAVMGLILSHNIYGGRIKKRWCSIDREGVVDLGALTKREVWIWILKLALIKESFRQERFRLRSRCAN